MGRAHGLDGSFHVTSPRPRLLTLGMPTDLGEIVRRVGTDERPVIRLQGLETREAAEALHGQPLQVALKDAPPPNGTSSTLLDFSGVVARGSIASSAWPLASALATWRWVRNQSNQCGTSVKTSIRIEEA